MIGGSGGSAVVDIEIIIHIRVEATEVEFDDFTLGGHKSDGTLGVGGIFGVGSGIVVEDETVVDGDNIVAVLEVVEVLGQT